MGIQQGSLSLCRYRVLANDPVAASVRTSIKQLSTLLEPHKAGPVRLSGVNKEEIVGWVRPVGIDQLSGGQDATSIDLDANWDASHAQVDDGILLRLRIERRSVPAALAQLVFKEKFRHEEQKSGKTPGPKRRKELREATKLELLGRALPNLAYVDAFWREPSRDLYVFTTGKKTREIFSNLFMETFGKSLGLTLVLLDPPLIGLPRSAFDDPELASEATRLLSLTTPVTMLDPNKRITGEHSPRTQAAG